jgi:hypothetical protein
VIELRKQGMSLRAIRTAIDAKWGDRGPSTKTPLPPG